MKTPVPVIFYPVCKKVEAPTALMFCEMQTTIEEIVSPLRLVRKTPCILRLMAFQQVLLFLLSLSLPALPRSRSSGCPTT